MDTICVPCNPTCASCFAPGIDKCKTCSDVNKRKYPYNPDVPGHCLIICPLAFQYPTVAEICSDCHESCAECFGPTENDCLSCRDPNKMKYPLLFGVMGTCKDPCAPGLYRPATSLTTCMPCYYTCQTCTGEFP